MRIVCISDTHNNTIRNMPEGDILIHAGDLTGLGTLSEVKMQLEWLVSLKDRYKDIVFIAGNHDFLFEKTPQMARMLVSEYPQLTYLEDEYKIIQGKKIWGSPVTPRFYNWAFNRDADIQDHWDMIPDDIDILVTHGPPKFILDWVGNKHAGCPRLAETILRVKPELHVFGHIHYSHALKAYYHGTKSYTAINASVTDNRNRLVHESIEIDI